jgi:hypothetical protein
MVLLIAHIELKCILATIKEDNQQYENCQYNKYYFHWAISMFETQLHSIVFGRKKLLHFIAKYGTNSPKA